MLCRLSRVCDVTFSSNHSVVACLCALMCVCVLWLLADCNGLCYTCESFARRLVNTQRTSDSFPAANTAFYRTTCINNQRCFAVYRHTTMYLYRIYYLLFELHNNFLGCTYACTSRHRVTSHLLQATRLLR